MPIYSFDDFQLDTKGYKLRDRDTLIATEPLVFNLLVYLVENAGRVVTKDEIIDQIWDGRFVSDSTVSTAIKEARKALRDSGDAQRFIKTVRGRGFEFVGDVEAIPTKTSSVPSSQTYLAPRLFVHVAESEKRAQKLAARLRSVLTRIPLLDIVAPNPSSISAAETGQLRDHCAVTFLLVLDVTELDGHHQLDAALIETDASTQLWARSVNVDPADTSYTTALQSLMRYLEPAIIRAMITGMRSSPTEEPKAHLLQAMGLIFEKGWSSSTFQEAEKALEDVVARDPDLALAHAFLSLTRALGHRFGIRRDDDGIVERAVSSAETALKIESSDSMTLGMAGCALADVGQVARAMPILKKSVSADPNNGHALSALGAAYMAQKQFAEGERFLRQGIELSPADVRLAVWGSALSIALLLQGKLEEAKEAAEAANQEDFDSYMPYLAMAAIAMSSNDQSAAHVALVECLRVRPEITGAEVACFIGRRAGDAVYQRITALRAGEGSLS